MAELPSVKLEAERFWAIPLFDSEHREWKDKDNFNELLFKWPDIDVSSFSLINISIAIAKKYPSYTSQKIQNIASGISNFNKIKKGDGLLGISLEREVTKVGKVNDHFISREDHFTSVNIAWADLKEKSDTKRSFFRPEFEIQKVTANMLQSLNLSGVISSREIYENIAYEGRFMRDDKLALELTVEEEYPKEDKGGQIKIFYGTNRNQTGSKNPSEFYGDKLDKLKYGVCEVNIPRGHVQGELERPRSYWLLEFPEKKSKHIILKSIEEATEKELLTILKEATADRREKSAMIFIHGYNTSFEESALRTAQIAWDIPFDGLSGFFSWPSSGRIASYLADIEKADSSIPVLEEFIKTIVKNTGIEKLHLLAHSMGNRILAVTLNNLARDQGFIQQLKIIKQIVLGAPDIDQDVFNNTILPEFKNIGDRRTLYSSDKDKALNTSEFLRGQRPRIGDAGPSIFVANGLDTVDASNVPSKGNNHSYIFETKELLSDLYYLLGKGFSPAERRLRAKPKGGLQYWLFPK